MSEILLTTVISAAAAIFGSAVTGFFTLRAATREIELEKSKRELSKALRNVAAFHRLEEAYADALATDERTALAWKREIRKRQRDRGYESPSDEATSLKSDRRISEIN